MMDDMRYYKVFYDNGSDKNCFVRSYTTYELAEEYLRSVVSFSLVTALYIWGYKPLDGGKWELLMRWTKEGGFEIL